MIQTPLKVAIYSRISTLVHGQDLRNQEKPIRDYVSSRGFIIHDTYTDEGISGSVSQRKGLDRLLADARRGKFKVVVVMEISRLARDVRHLLNLLHELSELGVSIVSLREGISFEGAFGKAMVAIIGALVGVETQLLSERIKTALAVKKLAAQQSGSGWKCGRPGIGEDIKLQAVTLRENGLSIRAISSRLSIGKTTVERILKQSCPKTVEISIAPEPSLNAVKKGKR
jgi:DNA invertase Pin-like site-specific DNA recombinase